MRILNYKDIATSKSKKYVLDLLDVGLEAIDPRFLMRRVVSYNRHTNSVTVQRKTFDLLKGRIFVIGGGKAAGYMAEALEEIIGAKNIEAGIVTCVSDDYNTDKIKVEAASHPFPDRKGVNAVKKMLGLKNRYKIGKKDLVICLISGGASALLPGPAKGVSLKDKQKATRLLLESGADINEINTIRKHLSLVKGGQLAEKFRPTPVMTIIISDVIGDRFDVVGSGVTVPDPTTFNDAMAIVNQYSLASSLPQSVLNYLEQGKAGKRPETPKEISNANNTIIADNSVALSAMALKSKSLSLKPIIISRELKGNPEVLTKKLAEVIIGGDYNKYNALFFSGETSPALPAKHGRGGRNMHLAALMALDMRTREKDWAFASISTDGNDYLTGYAGAVIDRATIGQAFTKNINFEWQVMNFNTFKLFKKTGVNLIETGDTGTNVGDIMVFVLL